MTGRREDREVGYEVDSVWFANRYLKAEVLGAFCVKARIGMDCWTTLTVWRLAQSF